MRERRKEQGEVSETTKVERQGRIKVPWKKHVGRNGHGAKALDSPVFHHRGWLAGWKGTWRDGQSHRVPKSWWESWGQNISLCVLARREKLSNMEEESWVHTLRLISAISREKWGFLTSFSTASLNLSSRKEQEISWFTQSSGKREGPPLPGTAAGGI